MKIFQPIISGSLEVSGSVIAIDFTGSLHGTSSYAVTASYALNVEGGGFPYTGSAIVTGSLIVTGSITSNDGLNVQTVTASFISASSGITGSLFGTASFVTGSIFTNSNIAASASYALTASYYGGNAISASYAATSSYATNFTISNTLTIDGAFIKGASIASSIVGSNNLFTITTGSYTAAFGKYTLHNGANSRAGEFWTTWNDALPTVYTDTSTTDIGNTSDITFSSIIVGSDIQINAVAASSGWTIKMITTFI